MGIRAGVLLDFFLYYIRQWQTGNGRKVGMGRVRKAEEEAGYGEGGMRVNVKGDIGEKTTCAVGILFIILATGTTRSSTTTSTSTDTTTPLTATSKCIGIISPTQYILGVQLCFPTKIVQ